MSDITVLGGTKFFGIKLVEKLITANHNITVISRAKELPESLQGKVTYVNEDLSLQNNESPKALLTRLNTLFSSMSIDIVIDNISLKKGDVAAIIAALINTNKKIKQYILCSSVAAYNNWNEHKTIEEWSLNPLKEESANLNAKGYHPQISSPTFGGFYPIYAEGKRTVESELLKTSSQYNFASTIIRPAVIEGPHDPAQRTWYWIQRLLDKEPILIPAPETKTFYKHIYSEDVAALFFSTIENPKAFNQTFNAAGDEILSVESYLFRLADLLNIPRATLKLVPVVPKEAATKINNFEFPAFFSEIALITDINKAKKNLDYKPQAFDIWMKATIEWLLERRNALPNSLGYANRQAEIEFAKSISLIENSSKITN